MARALESSLKSVSLAAWDVFNHVAGTDLTAFNFKESSLVSSISLCTVDVASLKITNASDSLREASWFGFSDLTILVIELTTSFGLLAELAELFIPDGVGRVERISDSTGLASLRSHVIILDVIVATILLAFIRLFSLSAMNIKTVECIARRKLFLLKRATTFDVANGHSISNEPRNLRWHISETGKFIDWVERI